MDYSVIIIGEHMIWNSLMSYYLAQHGFSIAGLYTATLEAVNQIRTSSPDIVIIDNRRSTRRGARQVLSIKNDRPQQKVILLSASQEPEDLITVLKCGANGYLLKKSTPEEFLEDIISICQGETCVSQELVHILLAYAKDEKMFGRISAELLTMRERKVMELLASGRSNQEIADYLSISLNTVKNHMKAIFLKLSSHSRTQAIARWNQRTF